MLACEANRNAHVRSARHMTNEEEVPEQRKSLRSLIIQPVRAPSSRAESPSPLKIDSAAEEEG
jgi:hypothetical protein